MEYERRRMPVPAALLVTNARRCTRYGGRSFIASKGSDRNITAPFVQVHSKIGIEALKLVRRNEGSVKHRRVEENLEVD